MGSQGSGTVVTDAQIDGTRRFVYNAGLAIAKDALPTVLNTDDVIDTVRNLVKFSEEEGGAPWLAERPADAIEAGFDDLRKALDDFYSGRTSFPDWKRKRKGKQ